MILPIWNLILFSLKLITSLFGFSASKLQSWKAVLRGKIIEEKSEELFISILDEDNLWLSVATPVK